MWAGWSMMVTLLDVMSSLLERELRFEYLINLGDADLTMCACTIRYTTMYYYATVLLNYFTTILLYYYTRFSNGICSSSI